jgi:hypothetical protein
MAGVIISCAITGAVHAPTMNPHWPVNPKKSPANRLRPLKPAPNNLHAGLARRDAMRAELFAGARFLSTGPESRIGSRWTGHGHHSMMTKCRSFAEMKEKTIVNTIIAG